MRKRERGIRERRGKREETGGGERQAIYVANLVSGVVDARAVDGAVAPIDISLREE